MPAYCSYSNIRRRLSSHIKPYEMVTLYFPTTWRHSNDGRNNDVTAPRVYNLE